MSMTIPTFQKDVYKEFHPHATRPGVTETYGNFTNRHGKLSNIPAGLLGDRVVFVGLQYFIIESLIREWNEGFFSMDKDLVCDAHSRIMSAMLGYTIDVSYLERLHDLGYLPLEIKALEEGTLVPYGVPTFTVRSTVDHFDFVPLMLESVASQENWPISTSATTATAYLKQQKEAMERAGMSLDVLPFMIHDFSGRGMFGKVAASMSGFAHLAAGNCGTDSISSVLFAEKYYGANVDTELVGASVNATEHSVTCAWEDLGELVFAKHLLTKIAPTGILAMVADTWDFWNWVEVIMPQLKDTIMARDGKLVTRPDSGDPVEILCGIEILDYTSMEQLKEVIDTECQEDCSEQGEMGDWEPSRIVRINGEVRKVKFAVNYIGNWMDRGPKKYDVDEVKVISNELYDLPVEDKGLVEALWDTFGGTVTDKGFRVLDEHVGAIYGDSITLDRQNEINDRLMAKGFAPQVVLGVGSYSYQYVTRDTHGSAMKATNVVINGVDTPIAKDPKTDAKKKSAKGFLRVDKSENGVLTCSENVTREEANDGELKTVFLDGKLVRKTTLAEVRSRIAEQI